MSKYDELKTKLVQYMSIEAMIFRYLKNPCC